MKILLLVCTLQIISLSVNASEYSQPASKNSLTDSFKSFANTHNDEYVVIDTLDKQKLDAARSGKIGSAVGGTIIGGLLGYAIFQLKSCENVTGANGDAKVSCELDKALGGLFLGIPIGGITGGLVGYNLAVSYSAETKSALVSTKFNF